MSIYHDEVEIEDMEYDEETGIWKETFIWVLMWIFKICVYLRVILLSLSMWWSISNIFSKIIKY